MHVRSCRVEPEKGCSDVLNSNVVQRVVVACQFVPPESPIKLQFYCSLVLLYMLHVHVTCAL